jgi:hypothetical protein
MPQDNKLAQEQQGAPPVEKPSPDDVQKMVELKLSELKITAVVLVDDEFAPGLAPEQWSDLVTMVRDKDQELLLQIQSIVDKLGTGNIEEYPNSEVQYQLVRVIAASKCEPAKDLLAAPHVQEALTKLESYFQELKIEVKKYWRVSDVPRDEKLYFLDYRMQQDPDAQGVDASQLLKAIIGELVEKGDPPGAVLMSRVLDARPTSFDLEEIAQNGGGFVRTNFRYLDKMKTLPNKSCFLFLLNDLLESLPLGRDYFARVRSLRQAALATVDKVASDTCALLPADFHLFANAMGAGGPDQRAKMGDHLLTLFTGLLATELRNDAATQASLGQFFDMLMKKPGMAPGEVVSHALHRLHSRLLYDCSNWVKNASTGFGDIYKKGRDTTGFYIVITPECDLEPRYDKDGVPTGPKVPLIVLLRGELRDERPPDKEKDHGNEVVTPLVVDPESDKVRWIYWHLQTPSLVPWKRLTSTSKRFSKWGRLRVQESEKIQMRYSTDLLAVGTDDVSDRVEKRDAALWRINQEKPQEQVELDKFFVMEIVNPKKSNQVYWALGANCEHVLCSDAEPMVPAAVVADLRSYQPKVQFIEKLRPYKIRIVEGGVNAQAKSRQKGKDVPQGVTSAQQVGIEDLIRPSEQTSTQVPKVPPTSLGESAPLDVRSQEKGPTNAVPESPTSKSKSVINFGWFSSKQVPGKWTGPILQAEDLSAESSNELAEAPDVAANVDKTLGGPTG